jgi:tRNA(Ile)-lysidine synthase
MGLRISCCPPEALPQWADVGRNHAYFDLDRISFPLVVRLAAPGDRFTPLGAAGSQKLKKYFTDHHVDRRTRQRCAVLADPHRIVWLVGHRMDDFAKITATTVRILHVEYFLLDTL